MWIYLLMTLELLTARCSDSPQSFHYPPRNATLNWIWDITLPQLNKRGAMPLKYIPPELCLASSTCLRIEVYLENSVTLTTEIQNFYHIQKDV